jgi:hypothetical protein
MNELRADIQPFMPGAFRGPMCIGMGHFWGEAVFADAVKQPYWAFKEGW